MKPIPSEEIFQQFLYSSNLIRRYLYRINSEIGGGDLHQGQGRLLRLLEEQEGITQKELLQRLKVRPASLSELLAKLQQKGYIARRPNAGDKRVSDIRLTEKGRRAAHLLKEAKREFGRELFSSLNDGEREQFSLILSSLIDSLEEKLGEKEPE